MEKLKQKLAGFQRTRNGVIQKVATPSHPAGVSKTACTEEIAHLIDASVASKYDKQMTDMACTITEFVVSKFDEYREQFNKDIQISLPRQIRSMVLQANDERYEKQPVRPENSRFTNVPNPMHTPLAVPNVVQPHIPLSNNQSGQNYIGNSANNFVPTAATPALTLVPQNFSSNNRSVGFSSNMQQPFYQKVACSTPPSPTIDNGDLYEPVPNVYSNLTLHHNSLAKPSLPELQSHTYVASVPQPNSLELSKYFKDLLHNILIECGFEAPASLKENKINLDMNDNSVIERAEENNTCSDSIILEDIHLAMQEHEEESKVAAIDPDNVFVYTLDELSEDGRREFARELEEERQESLQRKSVRLQNTRNIVVTKVAASDHSASLSTEVSKSLSSNVFLMRTGLN